MGLIKWFSSDSRDCGLTYNGPPSRDNPIDLTQINSTPDPKKFEIKKRKDVNGYPIFWVKYPGVTNYEGNKILMYPKNFNTDLLQERMDPHFFDKGDSPIARFEPTDLGWKAAITLAKNL